MIFDWCHKDNKYHIMIPAIPDTNNRICYISSCTDSSIINIPVPGGLSRHVFFTNKSKNLLHENIPIELKTLCSDCLHINDPEKVKQELVLIKLQGKNYKEKL